MVGGHALHVRVMLGYVLDCSNREGFFSCLECMNIHGTSRPQETSYCPNGTFQSLKTWFFRLDSMVNERPLYRIQSTAFQDF